MFKYKTEAELEAMTQAERDTYASDKRKHEEGVRAKEIADAVKEAIDPIQEELKGAKEEAEKANRKADEAATLVAEMKTDGGNSAKKGEFIEFLERDERKSLENPGSKVARMDQFTFKAPALMTTANVIPNVVGGFNQLFGNYIDTEIHAVPKPENFILALVDVTTQEGTENIWYVQRKNEEGDAQFIGEGDAKPLADAEWIESKAPIKEVAIFWKMSNRLMKHARAVVDNFRRHAEELVDQKIDDQVLAGDGTGNLLTGIAEVASPFVVPTALANYYQSANIWDVINATATYVRLNNFKGPITVVLNTVWEAQMKGIKTTYNEYIVPPFVSPDGRTVSGMKVVFSNKMPADKILVGDLKRFKVVFSEDVQYYEGYENDDFRKNLSSFKLEAFLGTYFPDNYAGAIIYDDIATILTAIEQETP